MLLNVHALNHVFVSTIVAPNTLALGPLIVFVVALHLSTSGVPDAVQSPHARLHRRMAESRNPTEVQVANPLPVLVEKEVDAAPDQALLSIGIVRDVVGRVGIDVALGKVHLGVDGVPHPGKTLPNIDAQIEESGIECVDDGPQAPLAPEIGRPKHTRKVVVRVRCIEGGDEICERLSRGYLVERAERRMECLIHRLALQLCFRRGRQLLR